VLRLQHASAIGIEHGHAFGLDAAQVERRDAVDVHFAQQQIGEQRLERDARLAAQPGVEARPQAGDKDQHETERDRKARTARAPARLAG
jgi:hypothetical protein